MGKILRKTQKIFGQNGDTDEFAQFGTMKLVENGGTPTYSKDIEVLQNNAAFLLGWQNAVIAGFAPFLEELNALSYILTTQMAYILQNGIPEWDDGTTYYINSIVVGSDSKIYRCKTDDCTNVDPTTDDGTNWYDYELNTANLDLSNLTQTGENHFANSTVNNSKSLETGAVANNPIIYADILKYAHSTFDRSKFTVVGTPIITDDGIASGFSSSNSINVSNLSISSSSEIVIKIRNIIKSSSSSVYLSSSTLAFYIEQYHSTLSTVVRMTNSDGVVLLGGGVISSQNAKAGDVIDTIITLKSGANKLEVYRNGILYQYSTKTNTFATDQTFSLFRIGNNISNTSHYSRNDIDLKHFLIKVDGVEVFNGNKTGIDTIKPDDYNVVGTPTISADGIASGFSDSNYIEIPKTIIDSLIGHPWEIEIPLELLSVDTSGVCLLGNFNYSESNIILGRANTLGGLFLQIINGSTNIIDGSTYLTISNIRQGVVKTGYNGKEYYIEFHPNSEDSDQQILRTTYESSTFFTSKSTGLKLYYKNSNELDLNKVKVYRDGNLVYQPCLKIPYTLSKTGSKVVDVYARPRVASMYEQFGIAPYYTIDEANENFTLPMGEVYGMIQKVNDYYKTNVTSMIMPNYANGISVTANTDYTVPSDGWINVMSNNNAGHLYINGVDLGYINLNASNNDASYAIYPVTKGDIVKLTAGTITFYPCKGV